MEKKMLSIQLALFFNNILKNPKIYYKDINNALDNIFDAPKIEIPLPEDAPIEIPIIILSDQKKKYSMNFSRGRIDLFLNVNNDYEDEENLINEFKSKCRILVTHVDEKIMGIQRIGLSSNVYWEVQNSPKYIREKYLSDKISDKNLVEVAVRCNNLLDNDMRLEINYVKDIKAVKLIIDGSQSDGILTSIDINNVPSEGTKVEVAKLLKIIDISFPKLKVDKIDNLFYYQE
ncbi:MAG: hypothetical protein AB9883_05580 [Acidaminococcaceae bacterium]